MKMDRIILAVFACWSGLFTAVTSLSNYGLCEKGDIMDSSGNISFNSSSFSLEKNTATVCERTIYAKEGRLVLSITQIDLIQRDNFEVFEGVYGGKQINSTSSKEGKIFKSTGNTMRIVVKLQKSRKNNGFSTIKGTFSNEPFSSTCKCGGIQNGFQRCHDDDNGERKCTAYCNDGFVDLFKTTGVYTCNLLGGKWNNGFEDNLAGCVPLPLLPEVKTQVNFTVKYLTCNDLTQEKLFEIFYNYLITKEKIQQNSVCFKSNYSGQCLNLSCVDKDDNSFVSTSILDKATGLWNASKSDEFFKAYNASFMYFEKIANQSINKISKFASIIEGSFTSKTYPDCPSERFPIGLKSTCSVCLQGTFYKRTTRTCEKCPNGTFSSKDLTKCIPEKFNNVYSSKCYIKCVPGKELNEKTGFCRWCPRNSYKNDSDGNCTLCPNGKMTLYRGSTSVENCYEPCDKGAFFDAGTRKCLLCPLGTFQNGTRHLFTWCNKCSHNKVTYNNGSKYPSDCARSCGTGHFFDSKSKNCSECSVGYVQNSTNQIKCLKCPSGTSTVSKGTSDFSGCVKMCQKGTYYSMNDRTCLKCPLGTFMDKPVHLMMSCKNCSQGKATHTEGAIDEAKCYDVCKEGQFFDTSSSACVNCSVGTYQNNSKQLQCIKCPNGTSTMTSGSSNITNCIKTCSRGAYFDKQESSCRGCLLGTFMDKDGHLMEKCQKCPEKKTTYVQNATTESQCHPICDVGQHFNKSVSLCEECSKGFFQDKPGQIACMSCPPGTSTKQTGTTSNLECLQEKVVCNQGEFYNAQDRSCHSCENGTYQSAINHTLTTCQSCLSGRTNDKGAKSNKACIESCKNYFCKNGGSCIEIEQGTTCKCSKGFVGKQCEIIETKEKKDKDHLQRVESSVRFTSLEWSKDLVDQNNKEYKRVSFTIENALKKALEQDTTIVDVKVRRLRSGSVIADFDVYMTNNASLVPARSLQLAVSQGSVGGLPVDPQYLQMRQVTCSQPLGMENGQIKDENIIGPGQGKGRLNGDPWRAAKENDVLQIQLASFVNISAVAIQGDGNGSFVISYMLTYSKDGKDWVKSMDINDGSKMKVYNANNDSSYIVKQVLQQPIASVKFIRVIPVSYEKAIAMRIELYGCMSDSVLKMEAVPTWPSPTEKPVKTTEPNVLGVKSDKDEYAWGKYLGIAVGIIMAIVIVVACFLWCRRSKKQQKDNTPLVLTRYQDGSYREIEINEEEDEEAV